MFDDDDENLNEENTDNTPAGTPDEDDLGAAIPKDDEPETPVASTPAPAASFENFDNEEPAKEEETPVEDNKEEEENTVTVQPVKFASFEDLDQVQGPQNQNLNILLDVKLQLSVELGKTELPIKKVLELTKGSIVTLNKAAGEPVELYANGKLIAYGEVVVIEDNFGLRITHITDPVKRLNTINGGARED